MFAYDLKSGKGEKLHPMNERRYEHTSIVLGKSIYVLGGYNDGDYDLSSCERYVYHTIPFQVGIGRFQINDS